MHGYNHTRSSIEKEVKWMDFPLRIEYRNGERALVKTAEDIPQGRVFKVIKINAKELPHETG